MALKNFSLSHKKVAARILGSTAVFASMGLASCMPADSSRDLISIDPSKHPGFNSVCMKDDLGVIGFEGGFSLFGSASIKADLLFFAGVNFSMTGNASIDGKLFLDAHASFSAHGSASVSGGVTQVDYSKEKQLLKDFAGSISALEPTEEIESLEGSSVIQGKGGVNVIHVRKGIDLTGVDRVVLRGSEKDVFILNVEGDIKVTGIAQITVEGGVKAQSVVINNIGGGSDILLAGAASVSATFVAMERGFFLAGSCTIQGSLVAGFEVKIVGSGNLWLPGAFCVVAPKPGDDDHGDDHGEVGGDDDGSPSPEPTGTPPGEPTPEPTGIPTSDPTPAPTEGPMPCDGPVCNGGVIGI